MQIKLSEATAARRRIPVVLVDDTDGKTAETGITLSAGDMKISKNGAAEANHAGSLVELATGDYYYEATQGELDTVGYLTGKIVKSGVRTFRFQVQVVGFDPYSAGLDQQLADSVPADGTRPTGAQALYMLVQERFERSVSGTTVTIKKVDGSTTLMTLTLNDATTPTSVTRAT